jgi:hypothetical protein
VSAQEEVGVKRTEMMAEDRAGLKARPYARIVRLFVLFELR